MENTDWSRMRPLPQSRIDLLKNVLSPDSLHLLDKAQTSIKPDFGSTRLLIPDSDPATSSHKKIVLANALADIFDDNLRIVRALIDEPKVQTVRDLALGYSKERLLEIIKNGVLTGSRVLPSSLASDPVSSPTSPAELVDQDQKELLAKVVRFRRNIFHAEPSAFISRMMSEGELIVDVDTVSAQKVREGVTSFFRTNKPDFDIRQTSVLEALDDPQALKGIDESTKPLVMQQLKTLQRTQALIQDPEALPTLLKAGFKSAYQISQMSEEAFVNRLRPEVDADALRNIYAHASEVSIRNDQALVAILQTTRGAGLAAIDGRQRLDERVSKLKEVAATVLPVQANLEQLFGSLDFCDCEDCHSVTSPAAYFVELLQFLRNNTLDLANPHSGQSGIASTPLEKLFRRRPDLGNLELTCANTNSVLPYIDLANEVMESFIVHINDYSTDTHVPKQTNITVFNEDAITDATSSDPGSLLSQAQNTDDKAYSILKDAVYPALQLPYDHALDEIRSLLELLGTSRAEMCELFQGYSAPSVKASTSAASDSSDPSRPRMMPVTSDFPRDFQHKASPGSPSLLEMEQLPGLASSLNALPAGQLGNIEQSQKLTLQRANDAERLGLSPDEYTIITKQSFASQNPPGVRPEYQYFGTDYTSDTEMTSLDETKPIGLTHVKKQFLKRTGISYVELVRLMKTAFVNPNVRNGDQNKVILIISDDCDMNKMRLRHFDGTSITAPEYGRMHRFLRLWRKLGWDMETLDEALRCIGIYAEDGVPTQGPALPPATVTEITPGFLHQLVAVQELSSITGLAVTKLLGIWSDIGTFGAASLYTQTFLRRSVTGLDSVFKPDANGNILASIPPAKLNDHVPALANALQITAEDFNIIKRHGNLGDDLTLSTVSVVYRYSLLATILSLKLQGLAQLIDLTFSPWSSAYQTLKFVGLHDKMVLAGFSVPKLRYIIQGVDEVAHPYGPSSEAVIRTTKAIYDALQAIGTKYPDVSSVENATPELVTSLTKLVFDDATLGQMTGLLEGISVYTTNAPKLDTLTIPPQLSKKLGYKAADNPILQVVGILTETESSTAKQLSSDPKWSQAIDRAAKQARQVVDLCLKPMIEEPDMTKARELLLAGDQPSSSNAQGNNSGTAPGKRFYFLQLLIPYLRRRLAERAVTDAIQAAIGLSTELTSTLLYILQGPNLQSALKALEEIQLTSQSPLEWTGHLVPSSTESFIFSAKSTVQENQPLPIVLDDSTIAFNTQMADPTDVWLTGPVRLVGGRLQSLRAPTAVLKSLKWKTSHSSFSSLPESVLLPGYAIDNAREVLQKLHKASILISAFSLTADDIIYLQSHGADFSNFDLNQITLSAWDRLSDLIKLRASLPQVGMNLIEFFKWASSPAATSDQLTDRIVQLTSWKTNTVTALISAQNFNLVDKRQFVNEISLVRLQKAVTVAEQIGISIDKLFTWTKPLIDFWSSRTIASEIRSAVSSKYSISEWQAAIKPINDRLRQHRSHALTAYLVVHPELVRAGVIDADSLFEFFLIDPQMCPCAETSRMKQATSSVQLFIQRCLLGLEDTGDGATGVAVSALDRTRWTWMQKYRVWEANRKVFLYPENWIEPSLRDDKSSLYLALESDLLNKDMGEKTVLELMQSYIFKLNDISDLFVIGLFRQRDVRPIPKYVLHIIARTKAVPYLYYYRSWDIVLEAWSPWNQIQIDIPTYEVERDGKPFSKGAYVVPFVHQSRIMIAIPELTKKTAPVPPQGSGSFESLRNASWSGQRPLEYYEIRMGWSELRNNRWTQKLVSATSIFKIPDPTAARAPDASEYLFTPQVFLQGEANAIAIDVAVQYPNMTSIGAFTFTGHGFVAGGTPILPPQWVVANFGVTLRTTTVGNIQYLTVYSMQTGVTTKDTSFPHLVDSFEEITSATTPLSQINVEQFPNGQPQQGSYSGQSVACHHKHTSEMLSAIAQRGQTDAIFRILEGLKSWLDVQDIYGQVSYGRQPIYHELARTYSLYNWELGFHAPMAIVEQLLQTQQFELALNVCHYVFNPFAAGTEDRQFWRWLPFKVFDASNTLEKLFNELKPNTPESSTGQINQWRDRPFQPHVVARARPVAYMKWVAMKYIEILIAYGDYYFRQDTLETMPHALQCYIMASHVYGPRGQKVPSRGKKVVHTYNTLVDKWDPFDNAMVEMELAFPFSNGASKPTLNATPASAQTNIFGFTAVRYFCIPDNPKLIALRDLIDDRLFKIRHCQNILGVERKLPLYEPPIDPGLLVAAAASGVSVSNVLNDLNPTLPNYRFPFLLQKAIELCGEVKVLGQAFLSAKEKNDGETFALLRQKQERIMSELAIGQKKLALEEATKSLEALEYSRKAPEYRMKYALKLLGEDPAKVPSIDKEFDPLDEKIEIPVDQSGLKLTKTEQEEVSKAADAFAVNTGIGILESTAAILEALPTFHAHATPLGVGVATSIGPPNFGKASAAIARAGRVVADVLTYQSTAAARKTNFIRTSQDRYHQANAAGYDIKNIDQQIVTQKVRMALANNDINTQQTQIDNARALEAYLRTKYTNTELYAWYEKSIRELYYQTYSLAQDWAKKAEQAYRFERGIIDTNFMKHGYWEPGRDGLMAGERMFLGLKQLEAAYHETRGYDFEVSKVASLRQINPIALLQLRESGQCEFAIPEVLYDMDFPGQYLRKIRSVSLTIPCIVGPYTSLNCTLRLLAHKFRTESKASNPSDYPESTSLGLDPRFSTVNVPINAIAVSNGQNDAGVFELNFKDERFLPFEGAGAISMWRLELPNEFRHFDYETITDVLLQIRYTSRDGGTNLQVAANKSVQQYIKNVNHLSATEGLFSFFDIKSEFASEYYRAMKVQPRTTMVSIGNNDSNSPSATSQNRILTLPYLNERLPIYTRATPASKILATDILILTEGALDPSKLTLAAEGTQKTTTFTAAAPKTTGVQSLHGHLAAESSMPLTSWTVTIQDTATEVGRMLVLVRYTLQK
ncbi:MAG: hypothetical protein Q9182_005310 [Xanthomendoza sp. 2 TL-2023]